MLTTGLSFSKCLFQKTAESSLICQSQRWTQTWKITETRGGPRTDAQQPASPHPFGRGLETGRHHRRRSCRKDEERRSHRVPYNKRTHNFRPPLCISFPPPLPQPPLYERSHGWLMTWKGELLTGTMCTSMWDSCQTFLSSLCGPFAILGGFTGRLPIKKQPGFAGRDIFSPCPECLIL